MKKSDPKIYTEAEALELFDKIADDRFLNFSARRDGCFARAHILCKYWDLEGYQAHKAWINHDLAIGVQLRPTRLTTRYDRFYWGWHVTAATPVKLENGEIEIMIFDPTIFDGPVTANEWRDAIFSKSESLVSKIDVAVVPFDVVPKGGKGNYTCTSSADEQTDFIARNSLDTLNRQIELWNSINYIRNVLPSNMRLRQMDKRQGQLTPHFRGKTWKTTDLVGTRIRHRLRQLQKTKNKPS